MKSIKAYSVGSFSMVNVRSSETTRILMYCIDIGGKTRLYFSNIAFTYEFISNRVSIINRTSLRNKMFTELASKLSFIKQICSFKFEPHKKNLIFLKNLNEQIAMSLMSILYSLAFSSRVDTIRYRR